MVVVVVVVVVVLCDETTHHNNEPCLFFVVRTHIVVACQAEFFGLEFAKGSSRGKTGGQHKKCNNFFKWQTV